MERCRWMRWKGYAGEPVAEQAWQEIAARNEVQYACLQTFQPWGPDDQACAPERCGGRRACFEAAGARPQV